MNSQSVTCACCGNDSSQLITQKGARGIPVHMVLCKQCGLGYLNPRWTKEEYVTFYSTDYDTEFRPLSSIKKNDFLAVSIMIDRFKQLNLAELPVKTILDIGSGNGETLQYLKEHVYKDAKLSAIEPSEGCIEELKDKEIEIAAKDVDDDWVLGEYAENCDFIIMRHVLEHFLNPNEVLVKVSKALSPHGMAYIAVPNAMNPRPLVEKNMIRVAHTYYYNKETLVSMLSKVGLKAKHIIEGDKHNAYELVILAEKSSSQTIYEVPMSNFDNQLFAIKERIRLDHNILYRIRYFIKRRIEKYLSFLIKR